MKSSGLFGCGAIATMLHPSKSQFFSCETDGASGQRANESTRRFVAEVASEVSSQYLCFCDF
jgi:hypothetical protein